MSADIICDNCAERPAEDGGWFCTPCTDSLLQSYIEKEANNEPEDPCSECIATPASLFGVCDDCYDAAYNTRTAGKQSSLTGYTPGWWEHEPPAPPVIPPFEAEVTRHARMKASLASA